MPPITRSHSIRTAIATNHADPRSAIVDNGVIEEVGVKQRITHKTQSGHDRPPRFTINLSLPPEQRYSLVCAAYKIQLGDLIPLFDEVMSELAAYIPLKWIKRLCRLCLRQVYDCEENRELQGISAASGVEMYLLVCFNVLLDLFMGCSSGGAAIRDPEDPTRAKMLHFRTLDWGMPSLRKVVVQLDFQKQPAGPIIASTITYVGYVGMLTGVRKGLSISLNFRPTRDHREKVWHNIHYYWHLVLVLFGRRRSISSHIRQFVLSERGKKQQRPMTYDEIVNIIKGTDTATSLRTTACYLCLSDGYESTVLQRDLASAVARSDKEFVVVTNSDFEPEYMHTGKRAEDLLPGSVASPFVGALAELIYEAKDRRQCAVDNYSRRRLHNSRYGDGSCPMEMEDIVWLVQRYPTTNESTHYACVMDPRNGTIVWAARWKNPVSSRWIRSHED